MGCSGRHADSSGDAGEGRLFRNPGLGNTVIVKTTNGLSLYAHMKEDAPRAQMGDQVWPGDVLGHVGSTGTSTGSHLHYSTVTTGTPNPEGNGSIGFGLTRHNTTDPELFDIALRYPNQTLQAGRGVFGTRFWSSPKPPYGGVPVSSIRLSLAK